VLIHGIFENAWPPNTPFAGQDSISNPYGDLWATFLSTGYLGSANVLSHYKIYRFHYESNKKSVTLLAEDFQSIVLKMFPNIQFAIIAHSMGGLIARSYMNEVGAGHEVTILITLATPHHGSPAALLDSRDALAGPTWSKWFHLVDKSLFGWTSDLVVDGFGPNRSDLSWDNFDGSFSPNGADINTWLAHLNGIEIYQSKIHAYYGYIDPDSPDRIQEAQHLGSWFGVPWITHLNAAHSAGNSTEQDRITGIGLDYGLDHIYAYNDGIVPIESGFFKNANVKMFACEGFSHSEFFRKLDEDCVSSGTTDTLFDFLMSDLGLAVPPPTPAGLVVLSVLDSLFSGVSLNVAADQVVQLLNASQFPVQISGISLQGGGGSFALTPSSNSPFTLDPGQSQPVLTTFRPTAAGNTSATISVTHNASNGPTTQISLSGTGATTGGGACGGGTSQGYSVGGAPPVHPVGTFVKVLNDPTVYLIQAEDVHSSNVHADAIANPTALFNPYNQSVSGDQFAFENIITIDSDEMDSYSVLGTISIAKFYPGNGMPQPEGTLIQASGSAEISIVTDNASRRPFPTQTVFLGLGYLYCNVLTVSSAVYNSYSTGPIIEGTGDDFSVQVNPISTSASQGDQATLLISTATTSGSPESITLTYGNLPTGTSLVFNPASVASGGSSTLTATAGVSTPPGIYTITILGIGSSFSHSVQISLTVTAASGGAASVSLAPPSLTFPAQTVLTPSTSQTITVKNTGTSSLTITSLTFAGAGDYGTINGPTFPVSVAAGATTAIQVYFEPHATGSSSALMYIWDNAPGSPQSVPLAGSGLAVPPTYGTIQVNEVINGVPGASYAVFSLTGPSTYYGDATGSFDVPPGTYTLAFTGQPSYLTLTSITPSVSQAVSAGGTAAFIMTFTAPNDFNGPFFSGTSGSVGEQIIPAGALATFTTGLSSPPPGNAPTFLTLQILGLPPGANPSFNPQPTETVSTLTVSTSAAVPLGAYTLSLSATNSNGLSHPGINTSTLVLTAPPSPPTQAVSLSDAAALGNGASSAGGVSADGRYVVFSSAATNLTSGGVTGIFIRDRQAGMTTLVSVDANGQPFPLAQSPAISAGGRYVVFEGGSSSPVGIWLRDLQQGITEREDVNASGTSANGNGASAPAVSADGRFVAFLSNATNLIPGATNGVEEVYVRDRSTGQIMLASVDNTGTPANQFCGIPAISADGRFVAFISLATNLGDGQYQAFIHDMQTGLTTMVSVSENGVAANNGVAGQGIYSLAISGDGRFLAFSSPSTNLVSAATDGVSTHLFLRDVLLQNTSLVDSDQTGNPFGVRAMNALYPSISSDGRFVTYQGYGQVFIRDMTSNQSRALSLASDGTVGNASSGGPVISPGGSIIAFGSAASNLISGDTNAVSDAFVVQNPLLEMPYPVSITLQLPQGGNSPGTGVVTLSGTAPASGSSVVLSSDDGAIELPSVVQVPAGSMVGNFTFNTATVTAEEVMTVTAAYGGGSALTILTLEPVAQVTVFGTHTGPFTKGEAGATYTISVTNGGAGPTSGMVTVTETVPDGLVLISMVGAGWSCPSGGIICTRTDPLGSGLSYPSITVTVNISQTAANQVTNQVSIAGGGSTGASAQDTTVISLASQAITFGSLSNEALGSAPFTINATASSLLMVTFASATPTICNVTGTTVTLLTLGTCTIQVTQTGNANYAPASDVSRSFQVVDACDINQNGSTTVADVQSLINEALGINPILNDLNGDGLINITDVQIVINDSLGFGCAFKSTGAAALSVRGSNRLDR
jgi:uncharacterized repeat protein (TIGR01451 family)